MDSPLFAVRWSDHSSTLAIVFKTLLDNHFLVDCTITAEGQSLKAHRLVLSACSPYFQMIFSEERDKHPIVFLKDASFISLKAVIDFVYHGHAEIPGDQLDVFLALAKSLQIKGLIHSGKEEYPFCNAGLANPCLTKENDTCEVQINNGNQEGSSKNSSEEPSHHQSDNEGVGNDLVKDIAVAFDKQDLNEHSSAAESPPVKAPTRLRRRMGNQLLQSCPRCRMKFPTPFLLRKHLLAHPEDKFFICNVCGAIFLENRNLKFHMRSHTGERRYLCDICGVAFINAVNLKTHKFIHTGERPYRCDICGDNFRQLHSLTIHKRNHTGERPYPCSVCGKRFTQSCHLNAHMVIHTGQRPYRCDICGKDYNNSSNFRQHRRKHDVDLPFVCDVCGESFLVQKSLLKHKGLKHWGHPRDDVNADMSVRTSSSTFPSVVVPSMDCSISIATLTAAETTLTNEAPSSGS